MSVRSQRELLEASAPGQHAGGAVPDLDVDANELALVYRARGMSPDDAAVRAAEMLADHTLRDHHQTDSHEAVGTGFGAASSSFAFFASGAVIPILPFLFGLGGTAGLLLGALLVGCALLATGAIVGLLSGAPPLRRALRQLLIGVAAAAATYLLGLVFGASVG